MVVCGQVLCLHQDLEASQQLFLKRSVCFYCTENDCAPKPHRPSAVKVLLLVGLPQDQYSISSFHGHCAHFLFCLFLSCQPFLTPETYLLCPLRFTVYCQQSSLDFQSKQFFTFFLQCKPGSP